MENFALRKEIDQLIASDAATRAYGYLDQLWSAPPKLTNSCENPIGDEYHPHYLSADERSLLAPARTQ